MPVVFRDSGVGPVGSESFFGDRVVGFGSALRAVSEWIPEKRLEIVVPLVL